MALSVDRVDRIAEELFKVFTSLRDGLAVIGTIYTVNKCLSYSGRACSMLKTHAVARLFHADLSQRYGPWAVVTGCTGGIGHAYTMELAARGLHLILISRSSSKLAQLSQELEQTFNVKTACIAVDFNDGRLVYETIRKGIEGKEIGILVNNVGVNYDYPMEFLEVSQDKLWQLVHVNVAAATMMTHMVLPQMAERRRGAVINIASGASAKPTPQVCVYSATKAYLDYFSRALNYEYRSKGVRIQCLMPFYIATRMTQYSQTLSNPSLFIPTATTFVRHALSTLGWSDRTTGYWPHTIQFWLASLIPEWLWLWGATRLHNALRRQAKQRLRHRSGSRQRSRPSSALLPESSSQGVLSTATGFPSSSSLDQLARLTSMSSVSGIQSSSSLDQVSGATSSSSSEYVDAKSSLSS